MLWDTLNNAISCAVECRFVDLWPVAGSVLLKGVGNVTSAAYVSPHMEAGRISLELQLFNDAFKL